VRAKITTTIEEALLNKAKALAGQEGFVRCQLPLLKGRWSCILPVFNVKYGENRCQRLDKEAGSKRDLILYEKSSAEKPWRTTGRKITHRKA